MTPGLLNPLMTNCVVVGMGITPQWGALDYDDLLAGLYNSSPFLPGKQNEEVLRIIEHATS
jgi:hypothetical protein